MFLVTLETKDAAKSALLKDLETERAKLQSLQVIVSVVIRHGHLNRMLPRVGQLCKDR